MPKKISKFKGFKPKAGRATNGIAVIFDLEGFSRFFNQPDIHDYIPKYLNHVFNAVESALFGGKCYWYEDLDNKIFKPLDILPVHRKFVCSCHSTPFIRTRTLISASHIGGKCRKTSRVVGLVIFAHSRQRWSARRCPGH